MFRLKISQPRQLGWRVMSAQISDWNPSTGRCWAARATIGVNSSKDTFKLRKSRNALGRSACSIIECHAKLALSLLIFRTPLGVSYTMIRSQLPPSLISELHNFPSQPHAPGALLITGLPLDPVLPSTPKHGQQSTEKQSFVSEGCLTGIAKILGEPFAYTSEKNGEIIHNICPVKNRETIQSNESSMVELNLHVENAYFDIRPDYLALYCLRQDHKGEALTSLVDIRSVISRMDPADIIELQKPAFVIPSPPSHHEAMGGEKWSAPRPLFQVFEEPNLLCRFPGMKALDPQTQKALDIFEGTARLRGVIHHIALKPGNILLINNRKVAHGRSLFESRYDGKDRWLQRVYIKAGQSIHID